MHRNEQLKDNTIKLSDQTAHKIRRVVDLIDVFGTFYKYEGYTLFLFNQFYVVYK